MCTTSVEYRILKTVVLMVMSGMDPHTIKETWIGMVGMVGQLFFRSNCHSTHCGRFDVAFRGEEILGV
jgi:hypothetical protein